MYTLAHFSVLFIHSAYLAVKYFMEKQKYAVIVAGGSGSRMGSEIPKQFLALAGKPILFHTIEQFLQINGIQIILVLPEKDIAYWHQTTAQTLFDKNPSIRIEVGGKTRFQSVRNGLKHVKDNALVAVHDGVRPLIDVSIIEQSFRTANESGSAVTSVLLKDSVREVIAENHNKAVDRTKFRLIQTPQTFRTEIMKIAFEVEEQAFFTDCASVVEFAGFEINLIEGSYKNIKITTPEDLLIAEALLKA